MEITGLPEATQTSEAPPRNNLADQDAFLMLLVTQLKTQNPLEPLKPDEFVAQLAQFNSLEQLMHIRELLEVSVTAETGEDPTFGPLSPQ